MSWRTANWEIEKKHTPMMELSMADKHRYSKFLAPYARFKSIPGDLCLPYHLIESTLPAFAFTTLSDKIG
jgi:hypothetical protein